MQESYSECRNTMSHCWDEKGFVRVQPTVVIFLIIMRACVCEREREREVVLDVMEFFQHFHTLTLTIENKTFSRATVNFLSCQQFS